MVGVRKVVLESREREIQQHLKRQRHSLVDYPWDDLRRRLDGTNAHSFQMIGYGSLLDSNSAKSHIASKSCSLVLAFGLRRLFNYLMPDAYRQAWQIDNESNRTAALNVNITNTPTDIVNGILVDVAASEIDELLEREQGYDLYSAPYIPWDDPTADIQVAYALSARQASSLGSQFVRKDILPADGYLDLCCRGAKSGGDDFLESFLDSTYLADGVTTIREYIDTSRF